MIKELTLEDLQVIRTVADELAASELTGARWERAYVNLSDAADVLIGLMERAAPDDYVIHATLKPYAEQRSLNELSSRESIDALN